MSVRPDRNMMITPDSLENRHPQDQSLERERARDGDATEEREEGGASAAPADKDTTS